MIPTAAVQPAGYGIGFMQIKRFAGHGLTQLGAANPAIALDQQASAAAVYCSAELATSSARLLPIALTKLANLAHFGWAACSVSYSRSRCSLAASSPFLACVAPLRGIRWQTSWGTLLTACCWLLAAAVAQPAVRLAAILPLFQRHHQAPLWFRKISA